MASQNLIRFLQSSGQLNPQKATEIAAQFKAKSLKKNVFLLQAGQISNDYVFLENGFMRAFPTDTEGNDITTGFYSANTVVFEVSSFFQRTPSLENIQALTDCDGWGITFAELNDLFHSLPKFREFGRGVLVKGYAALKTRMLATITQTAEEHYAFLVKTRPEILQHAPLKHIASYLGITDTSLSRIRKELAKNSA